MTAQIDASKLARGLGAALERVVRGETIEIIRYGRVVAVLAPPPKERRGPRSVQPDKLGSADPLPTPTDAVSPQARPAGTVGKIDPMSRQRRVDEILKGSRRGRDGD